jgi:energy-coupling factor transporter transmembrane protein EcfT
MGFNPYRKFVAKRADYVFVIAAVAAVIGLLIWALLG